jgi:hypothetical protein
MLVTLVLTSSPTLARTRQAGPIDRSGSDLALERLSAANGVEHRAGGRRVLANRQIRPSGTGLVMALARAIPAPLAAIRPEKLPECTPAQWLRDRTPITLLSLPPPRS